MPGAYDGQGMLWLAQIVSGGEAVKKLTDQTWQEPGGWWVVCFLIIVSLLSAVLIWRIILRSDRIDKAYQVASEDKVKLAGSSLTVIEQVKNELRELRDEVRELTSLAQKIWEHMMRGGK
jgi:membrane protein implicated in regulation of membrane protease activity